MNDDPFALEPEALSDCAFRNRQLLRAWRERRREHQRRAHELKGKLKERRRRLVDTDSDTR